MTLTTWTGSPSTFDVAELAYRLAERLAGTEFVPTALRKRPEAVMACILAGHEVGIGPMQSLAKVHVIEGRPTLAAETMRALVQRAGHRLWTTEFSTIRVTICGQRHGDEHIETVSWGIDDARRAGLANRQPWQKFPRAMLLARATAELCRLQFADVLGGISYVPEELDDQAFQIAAGNGDEPAAEARPIVVAGTTLPARPARRPAQTRAKEGPVPATPNPTTHRPVEERPLPPLPHEVDQPGPVATEPNHLEAPPCEDDDPADTPATHPTPTLTDEEWADIAESFDGEPFRWDPNTGTWIHADDGAWTSDLDDELEEPERRPGPGQLSLDEEAELADLAERLDDAAAVHHGLPPRTATWWNEQAGRHGITRSALTRQATQIAVELGADVPASLAEALKIPGVPERLNHWLIGDRPL